MTPRQLKELIQLTIRSEIAAMEKRILSEIRSTKGQMPLTEKTQRAFREQYQSAPRRTNKPLSNDPLLNELLTTTKPLSAAEIANVDASSILDNDTALHEIMNRDYSQMFKQEPVKSAPIKRTPTNSDLRAKYAAMMNDEPTNGGDEEDFSFLDQLG